MKRNAPAIAEPPAASIGQALQARELTTRATQFRANTWREDDASVEIVVATDAPTLVVDWYRWEMVNEVLRLDLIGDRMPEQIPFLAEHIQGLDYQLGSVRELRIERDGERVNLVGRAYFMRPADAATGAIADRIRHIMDLMRNNHARDISAGYRVNRYVDIPAGERVTVEGVEYYNEESSQYALRIATEIRIIEGSAVVVGADEFSKVRSVPTRDAEQGATKMDKRLREYLESLGLSRDADASAAWQFLGERSADEQARAAEILRGDAGADDAGEGDAGEGDQGDSQRSSGNADADAGEGADNGAEAERGRINRIRRLRGAAEFPGTIDTAIDEGWNVLETEAALYRAFTASGRSAPAAAGNPTGPANRRRDTDRDSVERAQVGMIASVIQSARDPIVNSDGRQTGSRNFNQDAAQRIGLCRRLFFSQGHSLAERDQEFIDNAASDGLRYESMSLLDIVRECARLDGVELGFGRDRILQRYAEGMPGARGFSSSSLANVLTGIVNAQMMGSFENVMDTHRWARVIETQDYKQGETTKMDESPALSRRPINTPAEHAHFGDWKENYQLQSYAKRFIVDQILIVNDNFDEIQNAPARMGKAAKRLEIDLVYAALLANANLNDGVALYAAGHNNLQTTGSAFDADALQAAMAAMMSQTASTAEGDVNLNVRGKFLIVPPELEFDAKQVTKSSARESSEGSMNPLAAENIEVITEARLTNGLTDPRDGSAIAGDAAAYYLAADSSLVNTIALVLLRGRGRAPSMRQSNLTAGEFGVAFDIEHSADAVVEHYAGLNKSTGAA